MSRQSNLVASAFSRVADEYDDVWNQQSFWTRRARDICASLKMKETCSTVGEIGCGTGTALFQLASRSPSSIHFIGVEPAEQMRRRATALTQHLPNVVILDGTFEDLPLEQGSLDYLYSIDAFHWASDVPRAISELARVLKPGGEMDLFFNGCDNGRDFIRVTVPVYAKYMSFKDLLAGAKLLQQLSRETTEALFATAFGKGRAAVEEVYKTYYDIVEGHLGWRVRVAPQLQAIPAQRREECDRELRTALAAIQTDEGIPYTIHQLHVHVGPTP